MFFVLFALYWPVYMFAYVSMHAYVKQKPAETVDSNSH